MRPVHLMDLDAAVRAVWDLPENKRPKILARFIEQARIADQYRKRFAKAHPTFGTGTISSALGSRNRPARWCDRHYRACLRDVLDVLDQTADQKS